MGKAFDVSKNIGFDGSTYFCKRCGKAGYGKATQVRGHLAMCPGTLMRKGVEPTGSSKQLQLLASGYNGTLSGGQPVVAAVVDNPVNELVDNQLAVKYSQLEERMIKVENHYTHVMGQINQPAQYQPAQKSFFDQHKVVIIIGVLVFVMTMLEREAGKCGETENKGTMMGSLGTKAMSKLVDTGITKGVAALFKS